jgi:hypothetical protein
LPEREKQSPLPEEWSEPSEAIRRVADLLEEIFSER